MTTNHPIACNLNALDDSQRAQHSVTTERLFAMVEGVQDLPTGYGFRLPGSALLTVAEFIQYERLCCPFFTFSVEVEPQQGSIWLRLTGSEEIRQFIQAEFGAVLTRN